MAGCEVIGCDRPLQTRLRLCEMHYYRKYRYGDPGSAEPRRQHWESCRIDDCPGTPKGQGYCGKHYRNLRRTGNPLGSGGVRTGEQSEHWVEMPTYHGVHSRLKAQRGSAKQQTCECGEPARNWAYSHTDPDERWEVVNGYRLPYSLNLALYDALCSRCHRHRDLSYRSITVGSV